MNPNPPRRRALLRALNAVILLGVAIALSPALQHAYGWWSQRQLLARWDSSTASNARKSAAAPAAASAPRLKPHLKPTAKSGRLASAATPHKAGKQGKARGEDAASAVTLNAQGGEAGRESEPLPPTRLSIPDMGVDAIVVQGLDSKALAQGPGHDPSSALPGQDGNCVLAAHRNVYGSWFYNLDQLWAGSIVELKSRGQSFRYSVVGVQTVPEADTSVLRSRPGAPPSLTLITCTMPHSPYRLVATAYLQDQ